MKVLSWTATICAGCALAVASSILLLPADAEVVRADSRTTVPMSLTGMSIGEFSPLPDKLVILPACSACTVYRLHALLDACAAIRCLFIAQDDEGRSLIERALHDSGAQGLVELDKKRALFRPAVYQVAPIVCAVTEDSELKNCVWVNLSHVPERK